MRPAMFRLWSALPIIILLIPVSALTVAAVDAATPETENRPTQVAAATDQAAENTIAGRRDWWSLVPVATPLAPAVTDAAWSDHPIDHFILSQLEQQGLTPAEPADPRTLIRRLSLTLTGLPPTPEEVEQFYEHAAVDPAEAYDQLVTRLLDSPHFGERWARHWMDVVRFAETYGFEWNWEIRDAWRYRDYLIRAFNADLPYDQLVREHLAGDLLAKPRINHELGINESIIGTAFYRLSETGHDDGTLYPAIRLDPIDNQIDTLCKAFQASTVTCARCHDHKLDAISTVDYYALVGILESSRQVIHTLDSADRVREPAEQLLALKLEIRRELSDAWLANLDRAAQQLLATLTPQELAAEGEEEESEQEEKDQPPLRQQIGKDDLPREHPAHVLQRIARLPADQRRQIGATWQALREEFLSQQQEIERFNADHFEPWADFRQPDNPGWQASGLGLAVGGPVPAGEFMIAPGGDTIVSQVLPAGRYTHVVSDKLNGTIRSPWLTKRHKYLSVRFLAGGLGMLRTVLDSCVLGENPDTWPEYFAETTEQWKRFLTGRDTVHQYYLELATKSDNPRWPERDGFEKEMDAELRESPRSWFGIVSAVTHDCTESPKEGLDHMVRLLADGEPQTEAEVAREYRSVLRDAVEAFRDQRTADSDVEWLNWALDTALFDNRAAEETRLAQLTREHRAVEATIAPPRVVVGMADQGPGFDFPVLLGGEFANKGDAAPRGYLRVLAEADGENHFQTAGSGRLELADAIASADNPLTARVMVNRIWLHLFGQGIVPTPDDFGHMGEPPSHPELLDYLASQFVEQGWSVKQLIRQIVASRTFRQASIVTPAAAQRDSGNRWLHHYPVYRLDAEAIRDSILTVSGRLDRTQFGPSIQPYRSQEKLHRKLAAGPLDGDGRRSVYIKVTRMEGNQFLELFDLPNPMACRGNRDRTNVPAQALALLNDPFLINQAQAWAGRLVERGDASPDERIAWMYVNALGRPPQADELERMRMLVQQLAESHQVPPQDTLTSLPVWKDACHVMFNAKELIYVR